MVGVDFKTNSHVFFVVDAHPCRDGAQCFGKDAARSAMEKTEWLYRAVVYGHCAFDVVITDFGELNIENLVYVILELAADIVEIFECISA